MNKSPSGRSRSRTGAIYLATFAAAAALTGVFAAPAGADPAPSSPPSSAPATSEAPASSSAPPSSSAAESVPPAAPKPQAERTKLEASVVFEKQEYRTDENVRFTLKIKNISEIPAVDVKVSQSITDPADLSVSSWGDLGWGKEGVDIAPGATVEVAATGHIQGIDKDKAVVRGNLFDVTGFGVGGFYGDVTVAKVTGHATGFVFGDKNGNGRADDGEQLSGITLILEYSGAVKYEATSNDAGKIDFGEVPVARYRLGGAELKGWHFPFEFVQIGTEPKELLIRGAPPLNGALKASMAFTQDSYKPGELAHVSVTLTNSGSIPLTGIVAACDRYGADYALKGRDSWGDLGYFGAGVTIAPGETRRIDVSEKVPDAALNRGVVTVSCDFGYREVDVDGHALAHDQAAVPGGLATVVGDVVQIAGQGEPKGVSGIKVVLVSDGKCPVIGERTTDADGRFEFRKVAPGPEYKLYFLTPQGWRIRGENPMQIQVVGPEDKPFPHRILAETGEASAPTVPTQPVDCGKSETPAPTTTPAGQGSGGGQGGSGLASTGADVIWLGALALAALGLGAVLVFGSRRRRQPAE
ncbi:SdrD B-like domain-containing protein [Amycolatopsis sp. WAC 04197]|uniref:SdrD B-like domain-containing protein n=1 Tax=Amycolatopsis sp. WAC 04197 TaxID=2203199 RepID=UPI001F1D4774|nr:SdrD B-like domain-containing protein [Amycolatopsis sp. WAC 04197]